VEGEYYVYYFGINQPTLGRLSIDPAVTYTADVLDTWHMTSQCSKERTPVCSVCRRSGKQSIAVRPQTVAST
jgi:hypothetical protein